MFRNEIQRQDEREKMETKVMSSHTHTQNVLYKAAGYINAWVGKKKSWGIKKKKEPKMMMLPRTSVVLLLLMIVAEFPLTLCRHPTLCLHHLLYFIGTVLDPLGGIEALSVRARVRPRSVEFADGVVALGHGGVGKARIGCAGTFRTWEGAIRQIEKSAYRSRDRDGPSSRASSLSAEQPRVFRS